MWRKDLADTINATNEQLGIDLHWEHRSFKEQEIDTFAEVISYNRVNLERVEQNESRQQSVHRTDDRQQGRTKRREEEI